MPKIIGVRFRTSPRIYYFSPVEGEEYKKDDRVVVETQRGVELATVIVPVTEVDEDKIVSPLKPVLRHATEDDVSACYIDEAEKRGILAAAKQKVETRGLEMKVVDCEYTIDRSKLVLYFTAEQRVDFRELVRDLASAFRTRIDLRQIGPRDECKLIGSLGACGLPCCCGRFESDSEHVSIKMAKNQNLALTPNKINGMCGRLLCCLSYENKTYEDVIRRSPKHGSQVTLPDGRVGSVVSVTPLTEKIRVRVGNDESFEFVELTLDELNGKVDRRERSGSATDPERGDRNDHGDRNERNDRGDHGDRRDRRNDRGERGNNRPEQNEKAKADRNKNNNNNRGGQNNNGKRRDRGGRPDRPAELEQKPPRTEGQEREGERQNKHKRKPFRDKRNKKPRPEGTGGSGGNGGGEPAKN